MTHAKRIIIIADKGDLCGGWCCSAQSSATSRPGHTWPGGRWKVVFVSLGDIRRLSIQVARGSAPLAHFGDNWQFRFRRSFSRKENRKGSSETMVSPFLGCFMRLRCVWSYRVPNSARVSDWICTIF